ncbi:hypothetical protein CYMTET_32884 [Cymbomonas tetramitiformis]|uniref:Glycosyltransferase family 32 protein n=1 Tax=Cymbomonas tetramitiformis TaxID=36881 RepID=A0AAE0FDX7_9CHLO|nr:hypothetical protein CYMTET_32884 [Cymbomonas tetramitiformis]
MCQCFGGFLFYLAGTNYASGNHVKAFTQNRADLEHANDILVRWCEGLATLPVPQPDPSKRRIPRIIHQTTRSSNEIPAHIKDLRSTWMNKNPTWKMILWDDSECLAFVKKEFPEYLEAYRGLPKDVERADFFRYMVILRYGGVYADMDTECRQPLDSLVCPLRSLIPL